MVLCLALGHCRRGGMRLALWEFVSAAPQYPSRLASKSPVQHDPWRERCGPVPMDGSDVGSAIGRQ